MPNVWLIAQTIALPSLMEESTGSEWSYPYDTRYGDAISEFAGRACYQAWDRPNPATKKNRDYLANIIGQGHESVFGHASFTFYITGISRNCTHEMIRHRFLAFSEMSQRYVHSDTYAVAVKPPAFDDDEQGRTELAEANILAKLLYRKTVARLESKGYKRKQAREAARAFLNQRLSPAADAEIRKVAYDIGKILKAQAPNSFQDIELREE